MLRDGYAGAPDRVALEVPGSPVVTYRQLDERAAAFAGALEAHGVAAGDRVMCQVPKSVDAVALYLGCLRAGAVHLPLNPSFTSEEVAFFTADAEPALFVTEPGTPPQAVPSLTLDGAGGGALVEAAAGAEPVAEPRARSAGDLAALLYTSGTTGRPKGAMLTHGGLAANARALHEIWGFGPADVLVHPLPIFHVHGLFVALHCALLSGCEVLFLPRFSVAAVLGALDGATVMMGVPTYYSRLLADPRFDAEACATVRLLTSGSAPMTAALHHAIAERTGHRVVERYGMTETGIITSNPLRGDRVAGTVGYPLPGVEVRVAGPDGPCGPGQAGMVQVRGPHLFAGYWCLPERTAADHTDDGWFVTGDIGHLDESGRLTLEGRAGDMIISGGENISPREIEACLDEAAGVVESAVVGQPDPDLGEVVVAFLVGDPDLDPAAVARTLDGRLARFKHPKRYVVVDELPRNAMGKVQKTELRTRD